MKPISEIVSVLHPAYQEFNIEEFMIRAFQEIFTGLLP
jgi:hypothetical protein